MLQLRRSADRGFFDHGWLKTYHTFSFADYYDPQWVDFGPLRVINDDLVAPGEGFGTHGHRDMEIVTYILDGELAAPRLHGQRLGHPRRRRAAHERRHRRDAQRVQSVRRHARCTCCRSGSARRPSGCRPATSRSTSRPPTSAGACGSSPPADGEEGAVRHSPGRARVRRAVRRRRARRLRTRRRPARVGARGARGAVAG